ncbi:MAG: hypothetical protein CMK32_09560 [Porticoccaceae bacterium]|nr:hypothetical protein [Porticoccaceae bacterium]
MRTIIAGGRNYHLSQADYAFLDELVDSITEVVCGGAQGADECGRNWAILNSIPVKMFPANWTDHGRAAGPIRNREMAAYGDRLIAFWDGQSRGTKNMIEEAKKQGLEVIVRKPGE